MILEILGTLVVFAAVLFLIVVTTRYIGTKAKKSMKGNYLSIVETINIGLDKQVHLIKVGDEFVLVSTSGKNIAFLSKANLNSYENVEINADEKTFDFKSIFEKYMNVFSNKKIENTDMRMNEQDFSRDTEGESFKYNLNRIRDITSRFDKQRKEDGDDYTNEK